MNNQQHQHHGPSPPQGQMTLGQYQGGAHPPNVQNASQYGQQQNQASSPQQHYQNSQQAYQGQPQYNQYQPSYQQPPPQQYQQQGQTPYRSQPQPNHQAPQSVHQPTAQPSSTAQTSSVGSLPRSNTPATPTYSSSNQITPGGAPARQYINETVAPYLLEGMKMLVREQPPDPLRALGEWLIEQHLKMNESEML